MLLYWDLGTNLEEAFLIWNQVWYALRLSPVRRRATCGADSPRRIEWQTSVSENAVVGATDSSMKNGSTHLIRTGAISEVVGANSSYVPEAVT